MSLLNCSSFAQDMHLSQVQHSSTFYNPALTGVFPEDLRVASHYRRQWKSVPVDYLTALLSIDTKLERFSRENGFFAVGARFSYDKAGDGNFTHAGLLLDIAYTQRLNERHYLSVALGIGAYQNRIDYAQLTFGNQFNGDVFIAESATGENTDNPTHFYPKLNTGINWHFQNEEEKISLDVGAALFGVNAPNISFFDSEKQKLHRKINAYFKSHFPLRSPFHLDIFSLFQKQGKEKEGISGVGVKYQLTDTRGRAIALRVGSNYRWLGQNDALIPTFSVYVNQWIFGFSYDFNRSDFEVATSNRGGPELSLHYYLTRVNAIVAKKPCPIF